MVEIKSVSDLSIRKAVNLYTVIVFLGFGILLFWLASIRYDEFRERHENLAKNVVEFVSNEVRVIIDEKQRAVDIFTEDYHDLISELSRNPEDEALHKEINNHIIKYLPDFFASNIMTSQGHAIIGDFDGKVGGLCLEDLQSIIEYNKPIVRVHPNISVYHYDIVSRFKNDNLKQIFFVSFNLNELAGLLRSVEQEHHKLMLISKDGADLIEVTTGGGREKLLDRLDYRLSGDEKMRIMVSGKVEGTRWHVIDMHEPDLFTDHRNLIIKEYLIVYLMFSFVALYMRSILVNQDAKRTIAEKELRESHGKIERLNIKLEMLSRTDSLTGLYNRRYFDEMIDKEWNRCLRSKLALSCILIDVDYFKNYNDSYGHQNGDDCLRTVSDLMGDCFKRAGDFVARYGGEEFVVVMTDITVDESKKSVFRFQDSLHKLKVAHQSSPISDYVTVSAGLINMVPTNDTTVEDFIKKADLALYMAKEKGRNQLIIHIR
jgi:diguanylate cyclase (GGDEF)-like protein